MPVEDAATPRDPDREILAKVDAIVLEALDADPATWPTLIDARCGDDDTLRRDVESLLYIERSLLDRAERPLFELFGPGEPQENRIGPWEVLDVLGEGGASTVYRARRADSDDPRPVALKLLRRGSGTAETVRRLRREGRILAGLRHPSIVPLLGGGVTDDGRPFLVMEWVDGATLDRHVERTAPSLARRLDLVIELADAVHHAHGRLVVHGDLKPANVLIDSDGAPRLLDFGIAKLLDPETETPWTLTATGARMLTPAYASPEQVRRQPLGVATDVWALGVILFELLTDERPFAIEGQGLDAWRAICEQDAPRPSAVLRRRGDARGSRAVAGDLDAIVARALRKEPETRYGSVRELADDLRRHRRGEPVRARRGTFTYRAGKFV
ncbi:MAG: serine/threonine-protein kinase, partial [Acidobacteriota bacterium]